MSHSAFAHLFSFVNNAETAILTHQFLWLHFIGEETGNPKQMGWV